MAPSGRVGTVQVPIRGHNLKVLVTPNSASASGRRLGDIVGHNGSFIYEFEHL